MKILTIFLKNQARSAVDFQVWSEVIARGIGASRRCEKACETGRIALGQQTYSNNIR